MTSGATAEAGHEVLDRLRSALPKGGLLPAVEWNRRHRLLLGWLWATTAILLAWSLAAGYGVAHTLEHAAAIVPLAIAASLPSFSRRARSAFVSLGLLISAALIVHLTDGLIESHFYFFVLVVALTLYEDWFPFLLAVGFVLLHHGIAGTLVPEQVYNHADAAANPWMWAGIHAFFVALAGIAGVFAWRLNEHVRDQMQESHDELETIAVTDSLTDLPNRRHAIADLDAIFSSPIDRCSLMLLDLDGFKAYNDTFGHPAGDELLARLGRRLGVAVEGMGKAYRLGGDEFCVIAHGGEAELAEAVRLASVALSDHGRAFSISVTNGAVLIPAEATSWSAAMRLADQRLYANKGSGRASATSQSKRVLLKALAERHPDLGEHLDHVGGLVEPVGRALGLVDAELRALCDAAELHDLGKLAIPDAILSKPGPLTEDEWRFMRQHTEIGERIVDAAPALSGIGSIIRSSHERWDGKGYPDQLRGEETPLAARIVAIADAFDAMTTDRPYRKAVSEQEALAELRACAGTQFDPQAVAAFEAAIAERSIKALGVTASGRRRSGASRLAVAAAHLP